MFGKIIAITVSMVFTFAVMLLLVHIFADALAIAVGSPIGGLALCVTLYYIYWNEKRKREKAEKKSKGLWN